MCELRMHIFPNPVTYNRLVYIISINIVHVSLSVRIMCTFIHSVCRVVHIRSYHLWLCVSVCVDSSTYINYIN